MPDTTTPAGQADADANATTDSWEQRYTGLQRVVAKRDGELAEARKALTDLQTTREAETAELAEFRAQRAAADEEARAEAQYEALRQRFEAEPPTPTPPSDPSGRFDRKGEPTMDELYATLDRQVGKPSPRREPDWSMR